MVNWTEWALAILGGLVSLLLAGINKEKKRNEDIANKHSKDIARLDNRVIVVETELMTEQAVRKILAEYLGPFMSDMKSMQKDVHSITIQLAKLPKRKGDQ
jgi:hypothetical protein